jgi:hypothetical protein
MKCSICHNIIENKNPIEIINDQKKEIYKYRLIIIGLIIGFLIIIYNLIQISIIINQNINDNYKRLDNELETNYNDTASEFQNNTNIEEYINIYEGRIQFEVDNKKYYIKYCNSNNNQICLDENNGEIFKIYRKLKGVAENIIYWIYDNNFWNYSNSTYEIKSFIINPNKVFLWGKKDGLNYI